jgi:hypothetical protein
VAIFLVLELDKSNALGTTLGVVVKRDFAKGTDSSREKLLKLERRAVRKRSRKKGKKRHYHDLLFRDIIGEIVHDDFV